MQDEVALVCGRLQEPVCFGYPAGRMVPGRNQGTKYKATLIYLKR